MSLKKNLEAHLFFANFDDDVAIIKERKTCFGWVADPPFLIPRQLLSSLLQSRVCLKSQYHTNRKLYRLLQEPQRKYNFTRLRQHELSRSVRAQFCDCELSYRPMHENQLSFFEEKRQLKFLWCVEILQEQKPDRNCDDWENESLTESFIARIKEENALDNKLVNKKLDKANPFSCFSLETAQDTIKKNMRSIDCWKNFNQVCQNHAYYSSQWL